jgi:hypothetical protein
MTDNEENAERKPTDYTGVIILAILLPLMLLFSYLGNDNMGKSVAVCVGMILLAIKIRWDLRKHFWFWAVIVSLLALHVPLLFLIQWPHVWLPAIGLLPIGVADCLIIVGVVKFIEKFIVKSPPPDEEA